jgi:hypothetical protein
MLPRADRRTGYSIIEVMIALTASALILIVLASVSITASKGLVVATDQARRQGQAGLAMDRVSEILRNAIFSETAGVGVSFVASEEIQFTDVRTPAVRSRLWLNSDQQLMYMPSMSAPSTTHVLAEPVNGLEFSPDENPLVGASAIQVEISYNYQSFRDYDPERSRNATFVTSVFMRNRQ